VSASFLTDMSHHARLSSSYPCSQIGISTLSSFLATHFFHSYVNKVEPNLFHTVSHAEFHDPALRRVLARYAAQVESRPQAEEEIMNDSTAFHRAAQNYKPVVTHFFMAKLETWIITYLCPVLGLSHATGTIEFGTTRGAIHSHILGIIQSKVADFVDGVLGQYADDVCNAMTKLDEAIRNEYHASHGPNPLERAGKSPAEVMEARRKWCNANNSRKHLIKEYDEAFEKAGKEAGSKIGGALERDLGLTAFHSGMAPQEWVRPGGVASMGYRSSFQGMQSRSDVIEKHELRYFKFERELDLYDRRCHMTNQVCSCLLLLLSCIYLLPSHLYTVPLYYM